MKKKILSGKLSLEKSKISAFESSKIMGGSHYCNPNTDITCDIGCQYLGDTHGSACKCL